MKFFIYRSFSKEFSIIEASSFTEAYQILFDKEKENGIIDGYLHSPYDPQICEVMFWDNNFAGPCYDIIPLDKLYISLIP
jgi:hypothetical protein